MPTANGWAKRGRTSRFLGARRQERGGDAESKDRSNLEPQKEDHPKCSWEGKVAPERADQKHPGQHGPLGLTEGNRTAKLNVDLEGVEPVVAEGKVC